MSLVSILVPCYNHEKYVEDCLRSLCEQSYRNIELIIIDDCSSDNSYNIIKGMEKELRNRFTTVYLEKNEKNCGITKNLNKMLSVAKGKYIKLLASDDMLLPDAIKALVMYAQSNDCDVIYSNVVSIEEEQKFPVLSTEHLPKRYDTIPPVGENLTGLLCADNFISAPGAFVPMQTYKNFGFYDENYILEDFEFWLRVSTKGKFGYLNKETALYRQNDNSLSRFQMSEEGKRRHRRFHEQKKKIFKAYSNYANREQKTIFYNNELNAAIGFNDKTLVNSLMKEMREDGYRITKKNLIKANLVNIGIYALLKDMKRRVRK